MQESANPGSARRARWSKLSLALIGAVPKAAIPAGTVTATQCRENLEKVAEPLKGEPSIAEIDTAGDTAVQQVDEICKSNKAAIEERSDSALKESGGDGRLGRRQFQEPRRAPQIQSQQPLADGFETLSRVDDVSELRRRLRDEVSVLRQTVEQMRQESEESVRRLETQVTAFQERVEQARKETGVDRLTGLGSRRDAGKESPEGAQTGGLWFVLPCSSISRASD